MRRFFALLLSALLLGQVCAGAASATAGSAGDPLISRSYIGDAFVPQMRALFEETAKAVVEERLGGVHPRMKLVTLIPGESLSLRSGQQFTLLSGAGNMTVWQGSVVNAAVGAEAVTGAANPLSRYILCEDSSVDLDITEAALVKVSYGARIGTGSPFADVRRSNWFYADVVSAVGRGLVNGMTPSYYRPAGTLTVAQCVKLVACMHQLRREGEVTLRNNEGPWYTVYVRYALEHGLLDAEPEDYDAVISRSEFVGLFYRALPEEDYEERNEIPEGAIPDLPSMDADGHGAEIYAFYRAGILMGYTADERHVRYAFGPEDDISRAEVATIMNRMFDPDARRSFTIEG